MYIENNKKPAKINTIENIEMANKHLLPLFIIFLI